MNKVVLYCRPGFEKECAAEITDKAARLEVFGFARVKDDSGYVIFECYQQGDGEKLVRDLPFSSLISARRGGRRPPPTGDARVRSLLHGRDTADGPESAR
ncbi:hypothetical protein [Klebsiella aerogenes]|uniref:hypothetical protein n=1 Tax=Klebsiella aerogenes TaxID=548 RepID=UPI0038783B6E